MRVVPLDRTKAERRLGFNDCGEKIDVRQAQQERGIYPASTDCDQEIVEYSNGPEVTHIEAA